jgi:hypothetical protein
MFLLEQAPQKTFPQFRQWCLRLVKEKAVRHRMQTSESVHSGGALLSSMLLAMFALGGKWKPSRWSV